jgi:hypothetical protein
VIQWSVRVEVRGPEPLTTDAESLETFRQRLADHGAAVIGGPGSDTYGAQLALGAHTPEHAVVRGVELVREAAASAGLPAWPVVDVQATDPDERPRRLAAPDLPELVGTGEVARILGVSRQRAQAVASRDDFPEPLARLASGPVWTRPSLDAFVGSWKRRPTSSREEDAESLPGNIPGRFRRVGASDAVAHDDADVVMDLIRNARRERLRFDALEAKLGWERPRLSWVVAELSRTFRISYRDGWASLRRCPGCGSDRIQFKEVVVGRPRDRDATIQGPPYCPDCGREAR